jgi:ABC-type Fe3+/spermidine/putrescine transport system ATPase subunit
VGHIEQIGTPTEVYNNPATEYVATFLGAANILEGVVKNGYVEVETTQIPVPADAQNYREGQRVKVIFRPEDVLLSRNQEMPGGSSCLASGVVEQTIFVGAYERVRIRLDPAGGAACDTGEFPYYLTTETPESSGAKLVIASRPKSEAIACHLRRRDRVFIGLTHFTLLPG